MIIGEHDFSNFCKETSKKNNNICIIKKSIWIFDNGIMKYKIEADRFLHHMVRFLVGTMIEVARGKVLMSNFEKLLKVEGDNKTMIVCAPAKGLFLKKIHY